MMQTPTSSPLTIVWEDLPTELWPRVVVDYSLDSDYLTSTDGWSVTIYDTDPERLRYLALAPVTLSIHGRPQLFGRVEHINRGGNGGEVRIAGRDHMAELVENNIDPGVRITEDMTLAQAVKAAAGPCGISDVFDESDAQTRSLKSGAPLKAGKDQGFGKLEPGNLKPEAGVGVFEWLNRIAARMGCTIQPGPTRSSVILTAPNYESDPIATFVRSRDPTPSMRNNIARATADENYGNFPTVGLATGKVVTSGESAKSAGADVSIADFIRQNAPKVADKVAARLLSKRVKPTDPPADPLLLYRLLYVKDDQARKPEQVERSLSRALAERLRSSLSYEATVRGHIDPDSGYVFAVDTMATVRDEVADVDERLWIASRTFTYSRGAGAQTRLRMWRPGSFVL